MAYDREVPDLTIIGLSLLSVFFLVLVRIWKFMARVLPFGQPALPWFLRNQFCKSSRRMP